MKRARPADTAKGVGESSSDDDVGPRPAPAAAAADESSDDDVGPRPAPASAPVLAPPEPAPAPRSHHLPAGVSEQQLRVYVAALPSAASYERSYMHRDTVTHCAVTPTTDFLVTASADGCVKFWKKTGDNIAFVKVYRAHVGPLAALAVSPDGTRVASIGEDGTAKFFEVVSFDLTTMARLTFRPAGAACWAYRPGGRGGGSGRHPLAVADRLAPLVWLLDGDDGGAPPLGRVSLHASPVVALAYNAAADTVISGDARGVLEYWSPDVEAGFKVPPGAVDFVSKLDGTDLFALARARTVPTSIAVHPRGTQFVVTATDSHVRLFNFASGKLHREYSEGVDVYEGSGVAGGGGSAGVGAASTLTPGELARRIAVERELHSSSTAALASMLAPPAAEGPSLPPPAAAATASSAIVAGGGRGVAAAATGAAAGTPPEARPPPSNALFDESGLLLLYPTLLGVKVVATSTNKVVALLGRNDSERFLGLALFQGIPMQQTSQAVIGGPAPIMGAEEAAGGAAADPTIFAASFRRNRVHLLSRREPSGGVDDVTRDVRNEPPSKAELMAAAAAAAARRGGGGMGGAPGVGDVPSGPTRDVCLCTDKGEVWVTLFTEDAPKACENFIGHCRAGYYDRCKFFRCIKAFMVQTGDPTNSGTGGTSIWGHEFEDEIVPHRRFSAPGVLGMANAGPFTNGSQFFITVSAAPWLDGKHTIFGRVSRGYDVIQAMALLKTDKNDAPLGDAPQILTTRFAAT